MVTQTYWVTQKLPRICTVILRILLERLRDLQYIFAVTSGPPSKKNSFYVRRIKKNYHLLDNTDLDVKNKDVRKKKKNVKNKTKTKEHENIILNNLPDI